jgi:hypothetical protein
LQKLATWTQSWTQVWLDDAPALGEQDLASTALFASTDFFCFQRLGESAFARPDFSKQVDKAGFATRLRRTGDGFGEGLKSARSRAGRVQGSITWSIDTSGPDDSNPNFGSSHPNNPSARSFDLRICSAASTCTMPT